MNVDDMTDEEFIYYCLNCGELSGLTQVTTKQSEDAK